MTPKPLGPVMVLHTELILNLSSKCKPGRTREVSCGQDRTPALTNSQQLWWPNQSAFQHGNGGEPPSSGTTESRCLPRE